MMKSSINICEDGVHECIFTDSTGGIIWSDIFDKTEDYPFEIINVWHNTSIDLGYSQYSPYKSYAKNRTLGPLFLDQLEIGNDFSNYGIGHSGYFQKCFDTIRFAKRYFMNFDHLPRLIDLDSTTPCTTQYSNYATKPSVCKFPNTNMYILIRTKGSTEIKTEKSTKPVFTT